MNNIDPDTRQFFAEAGVTEKDMQDQAKRQFIYDFIEKQGGIDAVRRYVSVIFLRQLNLKKTKNQICYSVARCYPENDCFGFTPVLFFSRKKSSSFFSMP